MSDFICSMLFSANGLYKLKAIADPMPSSVKDSMDIILVNKPFAPRYVTPINLINIVLLIKLKTDISNVLKTPKKKFFSVFFILDTSNSPNI